MASVSVTCPECSLSLVDVAHPDVAYQRDGNGNILCPNCKVPMSPVGERQTMAAEQSFKVAQAELEADKPAAVVDDAAKTPSFEPAETTETLTRRLREINDARLQVEGAKADLDRATTDHRDAKKRYDGKVEHFLSVCRRLTAVETPLPLFTETAAQAAQAPAGEATAASIDVPVEDDGEIAPEREPAVETMLTALHEAGVDLDAMKVQAWTWRQRAVATKWAKEDGTIDGIPNFVAELMPAAEHFEFFHDAEPAPATV